MKVFTFASTDPDCPAPIIGRVYLGKVGKKHDWHPVIFQGQTPGAVEEMAARWWTEELAKADKVRSPRKPKAMSDDIGDVI